MAKLRNIAKYILILNFSHLTDFHHQARYAIANHQTIKHHHSQAMKSWAFYQKKIYLSLEPPYNEENLKNQRKIYKNYI